MPEDEEIVDAEDGEEVVDLEEHMHRSEVIERSVTQLSILMSEFLRKKLDEYRAKQPDVIELLSDPLAKDALAELYDALMSDLDELDDWGEDDVVEAASIHMLMALSMTDDAK